MTRVTRFIATFATCTAIAAIIWQMAFPGKIYHCTDATGFDYLSPGDWVHGEWASVEVIETHQDMTKPDTIKMGWTPAKLWWVWLGMVGTSAAASVFVAARAKKPAHRSLEH